MARLIAFWWVPVALALAAVLGWETEWGQALRKPLQMADAAPPRTIELAMLPEYKPAAGPEAYGEVIDRPLFSPTRRQAPPPPPPEQPKQQMQTGLYQLTGTLQVGDKLYAFLREVKTSKGVRAAQGDVLGSGAKLARVDTDRVVLTQYDSEEEVKLQVAKSTRTTPVPPPPVPPPMPGAVAGMPGQPGFPVQPGMPPQPTSIRPPGEVQPAEGVQARPATAPVVPGSPGLVPFVPGVSAVPQRTETNPEIPPRRRGAIQ